MFFNQMNVAETIFCSPKAFRIKGRIGEDWIIKILMVKKMGIHEEMKVRPEMNK